MNQMMIGAIAMGCFVAGLFFFRYWRSTNDRFFLFFMLSFWAETANRVHSALRYADAETSPAYFLVRLVSFGLILIAIWHKNRSQK